MEKYFQMDDAKKELGLQMPNCGSSDKSFSTWLGSSQYERNVLSGSLDIEVSMSKLCVTLKSYSAFTFATCCTHFSDLFFLLNSDIHKL